MHDARWFTVDAGGKLSRRLMTTEQHMAAGVALAQRGVSYTITPDPPAPAGERGATQVNQEQAIKEARKRWGARGAAEYKPKVQPYPYLVGTQEPGETWIRVRGQAATSFADAFVDADRRAQAAPATRENGFGVTPENIASRTARRQRQASAASPATAGPAVEQHHQPTSASADERGNNDMTATATKKQPKQQPKATEQAQPKQRRSRVQVLIPGKPSASEAKAAKAEPAQATQLPAQPKAKAAPQAKPKPASAPVQEHRTAGRLGEIKGMSPVAFLRLLGSLGFSPLEAQACAASFGVQVARGTAGIQTGRGRKGDSVPEVTQAFKAELARWRKTYDARQAQPVQATTSKAKRTRKGVSEEE